VLRDDVTASASALQFIQSHCVRCRVQGRRLAG